MHVGILINVKSGAGIGWQLLEIYERAFRENPNFRVINLDHFDAAILTELDRIIIAGGDGTVSKLLPNLLLSPTALGIIPLGTGNDLARELGLKRRFNPLVPEELLDFYERCTTRQLTVWRISSGMNYASKAYFCNYASFGFDAKAAIDFNCWREKWPSVFRGVWRNRLGYLIAGLRNIRKPLLSVGVKAETENKEVVRELRSLFLSNIQCVMGLGRANTVGSPYDEKLECVLVSSVFDYLRMLFRAGRLPASKIRSAGSWRLDFSEPVAAQIDGEPCLSLSDSVFLVEKAGSISVLVPSSVVNEGRR